MHKRKNKPSVHSKSNIQSNLLNFFLYISLKNSNLETNVVPQTCHAFILLFVYCDSKFGIWDWMQNTSFGLKVASCIINIPLFHYNYSINKSLYQFGEGQDISYGRGSNILNSLLYSDIEEINNTTYRLMLNHHVRQRNLFCLNDELIFVIIYGSPCWLCFTILNLFSSY